MSKLLNALLDDAAEAVLQMLTDEGSVRSSIVTFCGPACEDAGLRAEHRAVVMALPAPGRSGVLAASLKPVIERLDPIAYGYIAPAWVPQRDRPALPERIARHSDGVHISAVDRVGHRLSRTYRIDQDPDGQPSLALVPELSGLTFLSDLATTILDEAPARVH